MLQIVETTDEFQSLREEWNIIAESSPSPLMKHEFFSACLSVGYLGRIPSIFILRTEGRVTAIAPFERVRSHGVVRLNPIGRDLHEPSGLLFTDESALHELLNAIRATRYPFLLARIGTGQAEHQALRMVQRWGDMVLPSDGGTSPYLSLEAGSEGFERGLSAARKSDIRRKRRRAERIGRLAMRVVCPTTADVDSTLDAFFKLEASGWKGRAGSAIISTPEKNGFFRHYGRSLAANGQLRMFILSIGNRDVAARMAIQYRNRLWELKICYDENFKDCSPGLLLTYDTIRYACDNKIDTFEFMGRISDWNSFWGVRLRHHSTIRFYPRGIRGLLCIGSDALTVALHRHVRLNGTEKRTTYHKSHAEVRRRS